MPPSWKPGACSRCGGSLVRDTRIDDSPYVCFQCGTEVPAWHLELPAWLRPIDPTADGEPRRWRDAS